jgi:hypothetical protein
MMNQDSTMMLPMFHGMGRDDVEQYWFTCEEIWHVKRIPDESGKIVQLKITFREKSLTWYMKYKATAPTGQERSLTKINQYMVREFHKPKSESQCVMEIKEVKQKEGETVWDYDHQFNILLERLTFQI